MAKYSEKLAMNIAKLIEEGHTISETCNMLHISRKTFSEWKKTKTDFELLLEEAAAMCNDKLVAKAHKSLLRKLAGYSLTESKMTYIPDKNDPTQLKLKTHVVITKEHVPDASTLKLALPRTLRSKWGDTDGDTNKLMLQVSSNSSEMIETLAMLQQKLAKSNT